MVKNLVSGPILAPLDQIWALKIFFHRFDLYYMLEIVASYHSIQFQGELINQTRENSKKPSFGPNFGPDMGHQNFFQKSSSVSH